ncbi:MULTISPECIES: methyltransferase type 11 [unclassified Streptomyces]|uniref:methyltransferase type 11 n=1 Tax=unclassified Streptomyces TaxID=2593676 RepID=UPI0004BFEAC6|nr:MULTISPECIES: methyltransferase type 11 [unclassified Streptomyces]
MTPTLVRQHPAHAGSPPRVDARARARDWAEIQERMLVPLYEAVYERLGVGAGTRLLGLGCGSGLALLLAAARGAAVTGVDTGHAELLALARERLLPGAGAQVPHAGAPAREPAPGCARLVEGAPGDAAPPSGRPGYDVVTVFEPLGPPSGGTEGLVEALGEAAPLAERGGAVVLAGWGPAERCATASVLRVAAKLADPVRGGDTDGQTGAAPSPGAADWRPAGRDQLEEAAQRAGLRPDGSGRVACPFGYADTGSAVRGLRSTGLFDAALAVTDEEQIEKELAEALHPHVREDGTVWMPNVFRYLVARRG